MKIIISLICLSFLASCSSMNDKNEVGFRKISSADSLSYQCHVTRWDSRKGIKRICGDLVLSMNSEEVTGDITNNEMPNCELLVHGGHASAPKGRVFTLIFGGKPGLFDGGSMKNEVSLAFYPESAPKDFIISSSPGSVNFGSNKDIQLDCSAVNGDKAN